jgi:hypothetical protein
MYDNELAVITINLLMLWFAYGWLYPRVRAFDLHTLSRYDLIVSLVALAGAGVLFYGSGAVFGFGRFETNWFWFALGSYVIVEIPFAVWYVRRYDLM